MYRAPCCHAATWRAGFWNPGSREPKAKRWTWAVKPQNRLGPDLGVPNTGNRLVLKQMYLECLILLSALESETVWNGYTDVVESKVKTSFLLSESFLLVCKCSSSLWWAFQQAGELKLIVLFLHNDCYFSTSSCAVCWYGNVMLKLWELICRGQCFQQDPHLSWLSPADLLSAAKP